MKALAVILEAPESLSLRPVSLLPMGHGDLTVEIAWSGVSTGTEKLLWTGRMPPFPGLGYPLVPGYESVGRVIDAGRDVRGRIGEWVFVPGATCYADARGLFGGSARRVILPSARAMPVAESLGRNGTLLALAATAHHVVVGGNAPDLIVGHGVLGRLIARIAIALAADAPTVWEVNPDRRDADDYRVIDPAADERRDYRVICDASGAGELLDSLIGRLGRGGEIVLAGFYDRLSFAFPSAFMREASLRISAEFKPADVTAVTELIEAGLLSLDGLISHVEPAARAAEAYPIAFTDPACRKMVLDWSAL
ncbi:chlorophyll synthesis pathway protein BchC [Sphingomonas qomolangmaensis]|uniref:Chlorophyll synthesis pathway protein BchC n=1 Tax=Sphingomonas qomolangmaensis TaxID=2918765 RepID=A0ABY5L8C9_9SPHN|nr:chlorophyll synthesis pathway protein BchC [Sphingomonas qomolangmaensis]UUL83052.1 chlorophyll synthesis pathway protein BchC [Sphingomonas qomolangmaensis]